MGANDDNTCVFQALVCAVSRLDKEKVSKLTPPSGAIAYMKPEMGMSEDLVASFCSSIGMLVEKIMQKPSISNEDRLKALLKRSSEVDDKMLLVSLNTSSNTHLHCICVDFTGKEAKIWTDYETFDEFSEMNLNKYCKVGTEVTGIAYIFEIKAGKKADKKRKHRRNHFKRKNNAKRQEK